MLFIQLTGLSGAGKTSIAYNVKSWMATHHKSHIEVEVIDADEYRSTISKDLGFSKEDREENIRRLGKIADGFAGRGKVVIIAAINPYAAVRKELKERYYAKTIWIQCPLNELIKRDTKGLYRRALAPSTDPNKIYNLTGINDPYETPKDADLVICTNEENLETSTQRVNNFIFETLVSCQR